MSLLAKMLGFSISGLAIRFYALGMQKRNLFTNPGGHVLSMAVFGYAGYWAWRYDIRTAELIDMKKHEILQDRARRRAEMEDFAESVLRPALREAYDKHLVSEAEEVDED